MKSSISQPAGLIAVLLDTGADYGDRDDAAMDLSTYDHPEVEQALVSVVLGLDADSFLADTAGESLAEIWCRSNKIDLELLQRLPEPARNSAVAVLRSHKPEWDQMIAGVIRPLSHE
jgi:hypothetical protein